VAAEPVLDARSDHDRADYSQTLVIR
jgi:hypothetical protein